jgi:hypothetical protein
MDITDIYRVFCPTTMQYTFFSEAHGTFSKINIILGHKTSLNKFKKIEITPCIISDHNGLKRELKNKRNYRKYSIKWRLNNTLLNDQWVIEEIREEIKKILEYNENEATYHIIAKAVLPHIAKAILRGKFIAMSAYIKKIKTETSQVNSLVMHLKLLEK